MSASRMILVCLHQAVKSSKLVVLPGVGTFGATLDLLASNSLTDVIRARIQQGLPTLCVCVGFQLLSETSTEVSSYLL
jgi:glutamine amidotransferase